MRYSTERDPIGFIGCLVIVADLVLIGAVIYVAWHFIGKFW